MPGVDAGAPQASKRITEIYSKYAKALVVVGKPSDFSTRPVGMMIEVVPAVDPATLKPGQSLPVQVLYRGKPAAGLTIETAWTNGEPAQASVVGRTNSEGRLAIPLRAGRCRITTGYIHRNPNQQVSEWETFLATLTFEVR